MNILLIGNYVPDAQESMQRYAKLMQAGLLEAGHQVTLAVPSAVLNESGRPPGGIWKWIGYLDKYVLGPRVLGRAASQADIVHICDHANAVYVPRLSKVPYVVTCHDLLAVRGAMGEDTDCPAGLAGRQLQMRILRGLARAAAVACVSSATLRDAVRLLGSYPGKWLVAPNALNYPYRVLGRREVKNRLTAIPGIGDATGYVLHVGSNLRRKNRVGALRALSSIAAQWQGRIVFAGQPLTAELRHEAHQLGVADRVVEVAKPSNELLEALYNDSLALLFPSRYEGFGWPIIEAQACGCPVICSNREPFPEVAGDAAILCEPDDAAGFGKAVVALTTQAELRRKLIRDGLENSRRYDKGQMIARFVTLYEQLISG